MTLLLIFIIVFIISAITLYIGNNNDIPSIEFMSIISLVISTVAIIFCGIMLLSSYNTAKYLNKKYNTNYTTKDIFWNEQLIISELKMEDKILDNNSKLSIKDSANN